MKNISIIISSPEPKAVMIEICLKFGTPGLRPEKLGI